MNFKFLFMPSLMLGLSLLVTINANASLPKMSRSNVVIGASVAALAPIATGLLYQSVSTKRDEKKFPAPGKLVDVGGYKLHINETGSDKESPIVILDAGLGCSSLHWSSVQKGVESFARVCSYDRAGMGWSDASPKPRTSKVIVEELHALLKKEGVNQPYILVGHSFGGINMRLYANTYPEEVYGVVLVDSSNEKQFDRFAAIEENQAKLSPKTAFVNRMAMGFFKSGFVQYVGIMRLLNTLGIKNNPSIPESSKGPMIAKMSTVKSSKAVFSEGEYFGESCKQLEQFSNSLTNKPLTVITMAMQDEMVEKIYGPKVAQEMETLWQTCQKELVGLSQKGKQLFAKKSGHMINMEQPEIIVEAVHEMLNDYNAEKAKPE